MVATRLYMDKRRLQEEADLYDCVVKHYSFRRKIITLHKGDFWTYLRDPDTSEPVPNLRSISIEKWIKSVRNAADYLEKKAGEGKL